MKIMPRPFSILISAIFALSVFWPTLALAAGISPSGGGKYNTGQTFTVTVKASGATFDSLQGIIAVSGPVSVVSFSAGSATWLPGKSPSNGGQFVGIVGSTSSLTVATIKLKGTKEGSGAVSVSGVRLAKSGTEVGSSGGSTSFTIVRAPTPPGGITVTSSTHPDPNIAYEATAVTLSWERPSGVTGFSYLIDDTADTTPEGKQTSNDTTVTYDAQAIGTHYFHIRGVNGDGWGATTHFKITIKEPDAKVDDTLATPTITKAEKTSDFVSDITTGTITGILLAGTVPTDFQTNLVFDPKDHLPAELVLTTEASVDGNWQLIITKPIPAGFYKLVAQGQRGKVLTPASQPSAIEISVANGGSVKFITEDDLPKKAITSSGAVKVLGVTFKNQTHFSVVIALILLALIGIVVVGWTLWRKTRLRKPLPANVPPPTKPSSKFW